MTVKSIESFKNNIATFIETLEKNGFTLNVNEYVNEDDDYSEEERASRIKTKLDFLKTFDPSKTERREVFATCTWSKPVQRDKSVYVHLSFDSGSGLFSTTKAQKVNVLVTDSAHNIGCKDYRQIQMPNMTTLVKRIKTVESNINDFFQKVNEKKNKLNKNSPLIIEAAKKVFADGEAEFNDIKNYSSFLVVIYRGYRLQASLLNDTDLVDFRILNQNKYVSFAKARQLIDLMED